MNRKLPTPDEALYGQEMKAEGYVKGYNQKTYDIRKVKSKKERSLFIQFGHFYDYIDGVISANRKH